MRLDLSRLRRLDAGELAWRLRGAVDITFSRMLAAGRAPAWNRHDLEPRLARVAALNGLRRSLKTNAWLDAHSAIGEYIGSQPARFVIAPRFQDEIVRDITSRFPEAATDARTRAERLLDGRYDLLGYQDLPFDGHSWHTDAVSGRTAPATFWSTVDFLDPAHGDHKVTWEFNRHQHWMELGRAYWLTGDDRCRAAVVAQLESWLRANPPLIGMNWASMLELAFRSLSWIWAIHFFSAAAHADRTPWLVDLLLALDRQLAHVERHLSYYFSPNTHLLGEALALYVAGRTLPLLARSPSRAETGRRVLIQEIGRQISSDGGHCERSPHYHRYTLDFYLLAALVARITQDPAATVFERAVGRLAHAARALADDFGRLPHIGDDDGGSLLPLTRRAPDDVRDSLAMASALTGHVDLLVDDPTEEVWWLLSHPETRDGIARVERAPRHSTMPSTALPATGYYVARHEHGNHVVIDGGPHGFLNGGHAHADALSLCVTLRGQPLLIDAGTACYTIDPALRDRFRSTALHNTMTLNGQPQSLPRGPFHWRHTAHATARRWRTNHRFDYFVGSHDGYDPFIHHRHVLVLHGDLLVVADSVTVTAADGAVSTPARMVHAAVHWHLDPAWATSQHEQSARLTAGAHGVGFSAAGASLEVVTGDEVSGLGWHSPVYGRIEPTSTLRLTTVAAPPFWIVSVFALDPDNRVRGAGVDVMAEPSGLLQYGAAIHIERDRSLDRVLIAEPSDERGDGCWHAFGYDTDARMLYAQETNAHVARIALVDVTQVRHESDGRLQKRFTPRAPDFYWMPATEPDIRGAERGSGVEIPTGARKAS